MRQLIREGIAPAATPGRPENLSVTQVSDPQEKRDASAIVARLKRDDPGLAQQVIDGALSPAHAGGALNFGSDEIQSEGQPPSRAGASSL